MQKLLSILLCTIVFSANAQTNILNIGVEGGCSLASLRGNEFTTEYHNTRIGYIGGIFVQYNFKKIFSLRTGGYYEMKGSAFEIMLTDEHGNPSGEIVHGKQNFEYINVPLLLRATFGEKLNYFVNAGPYIGFLLKQSEHTDPIASFPEINLERTEYFKNTETGITAGIGISYNLKQKFTLSFEARDNLGLTNTSELPVYGNGEINTNALNFIFGFGYKIGERKTDSK